MNRLVFRLAGKAGVKLLEEREKIRLQGDRKATLDEVSEQRRSSGRSLGGFRFSTL